MPLAWVLPWHPGSFQILQHPSAATAALAHQVDTTRDMGPHSLRLCSIGGRLPRVAWLHTTSIILLARSASVSAIRWKVGCIGSVSIPPCRWTGLCAVQTAGYTIAFKPPSRTPRGQNSQAHAGDDSDQFTLYGTFIYQSYRILEQRR